MDKITLADNESTHGVVVVLGEGAQKIPPSGVSSGGLEGQKEELNGHNNNQGKYTGGQNEEKDEVIPQGLMIQDTLKYPLLKRPWLILKFLPGRISLTQDIQQYSGHFQVAHNNVKLMDTFALKTSIYFVRLDYIL